MIKIRRVYEEKPAEERYSVFVDRLWPRGLSKAKINWDDWVKEISPSPELRKWFHQDVGRWNEFKLHYTNELSLKKDELKKLKNLESRYGILTLVCASSDREHNHALVIKEVLEKNWSEN